MNKDITKIIKNNIHKEEYELHTYEHEILDKRFDFSRKT